jgi:hypothetical protein
VRWLVTLSLFCAVIGCQAPMARIAPQPLPEDTPPMPYAELVARLRQLAMSAHEAFYLDRWDEVETTARALQQSARFLTKALSVPPERVSDLAQRSEALAMDAGQLRDAAKGRPADVANINSILQRIHLQVRALRPGA